ncbi:hypothetical protein [Luteolibacter sp. LG18]|uniref:hypothetical protein n=1 Tax=Luteolibacter sp. LG18 TaxID=2819286 RepID=UPI002B30E1B8|nr:hypothetical protein llg_31180 [Luteolibacter sp. LG18]
MRFVLPLVLFALHSAGFSQEARTVECRFLGFGTNESTTSALTVADNGADITCPLPTTQLSPKVTCYAKGDKIPFLSSDRKPLAVAAIPAGVRSALLVFVRMPGQADTPQWRIFVIEDSPKNFPDGGAYVANFYGNDIRFIIGEHKVMLHSAASGGYPMPKERDDFNMSPVIFQFANGEKWRTANESALRFLPGTRYLIFAYVDPVSGRPKISTYQDQVEQPAPDTVNR